MFLNEISAVIENAIIIGIEHSSSVFSTSSKTEIAAINLILFLCVNSLIKLHDFGFYCVKSVLSEELKALHSHAQQARIFCSFTWNRSKTNDDDEATK